MCWVDASTGAITVLGAGDCVVSADQAGNAAFHAAPQSIQTVVIDKAVQDTLAAIASPDSIAFNGTSMLSTSGGSGDGTVSIAVTDGTDVWRDRR